MKDRVFYIYTVSTFEARKSPPNYINHSPMREKKERIEKLLGFDLFMITYTV